MKKIFSAIFAVFLLSAGLAHSEEPSEEDQLNAAVLTVAVKQLGMPELSESTTLDDRFRICLDLYIKSAKKGNKDAIHMLGIIYDQSLLHVQKHDQQATFWFEKDAKNGDAYAQRKLGLYMYNGAGVKKDIPTSVTWLKKAAAQGDEIAEGMLGSFYSEGAAETGVKQDNKQAIFWYTKSASATHGWDAAQLNLGVMYAEGQGVNKDLATAIFWEQKAAAQGNEKAKRLVLKYQQLMNHPAGNVLD
jgi:hypothetical protein